MLGGAFGSEYLKKWKEKDHNYFEIIGWHSSSFISDVTFGWRAEERDTQNRPFKAGDVDDFLQEEEHAKVFLINNAGLAVAELKEPKALRESEAIELKHFQIE